MQIYNTMTRQKEQFVPLEEGKVRMYVCGPTVYNYIHIGNARPMIVFDTVRRYMEYKGYQVNYVSNFTDVDDKIIAKANEEGVSTEVITKRYIEAVQEDMKALNVKPASISPLATKEMDSIIDMVKTLIDKGYAYEKNHTVFYRTRHFDGYGKLSGKNIEDLVAGNRVAINEEKDDPMDFVLWKPKKEGEPFWESPWGQGRPGWHIECSAMSKKYLGDQMDIHAGGEDLVFPHHENEIAQSEACTGKQFAKYWMHNAFLNIDHKKMSKSLGNFFTVREILEKFSPNVLRFFMLSAHYRSPLNFSEDLMESAQSGLQRICTAVSNLSYLSGLDRPDMETPEERQTLLSIDELTNKFKAAMDDDINTADAISVIFELVKLANSSVNEASSQQLISQFHQTIVKLSDVLGLIVEETEELLDEDIEALITERNNARKDKNFGRADEIRDQLLAEGIILEDTREGVKWKRK